jgi:hypothetical protein
LGLVSAGCAKPACGAGETTCAVEGGSYLALLPPEAAEGPLPLALLLLPKLGPLRQLSLSAMTDGPCQLLRR